MPEEVDPKPYFALGDYVRSQGWTTTRLAKETEIPDSTLSELFNGKGVIDFDKMMRRLARIAEAMGLDRDDLLLVMGFVARGAGRDRFKGTRDKIRVNPDLGADGREAVGTLYDHYVNRAAKIRSLEERKRRRQVQEAARREAAKAGRPGVSTGKAADLTGTVETDAPNDPGGASRGRERDKGKRRPDA